MIEPKAGFRIADLNLNRVWTGLPDFKPDFEPISGYIVFDPITRFRFNERRCFLG